MIIQHTIPPSPIYYNRLLFIFVITFTYVALFFIKLSKRKKHPLNSWNYQVSGTVTTTTVWENFQECVKVNLRPIFCKLFFAYTS